MDGISINDEVDLTTDAAMARMTLHNAKIPEAGLLGYEYEAGEIVAAEQLRIAGRCLGIGMRCLADALEHESGLSGLADRVSAVFVPTIIVISIITFAVWYVLSDSAPLLKAFDRPEGHPAVRLAAATTGLWARSR